MQLTSLHLRENSLITGYKPFDTLGLCKHHKIRMDQIILVSADLNCTEYLLEMVGYDKIYHIVFQNVLLGSN